MCLFVLVRVGVCCLVVCVCLFVCLFRCLFVGFVVCSPAGPFVWLCVLLACLLTCMCMCRAQLALTAHGAPQKKRVHVCVLFVLFCVMACWLCLPVRVCVSWCVFVCPCGGSLVCRVAVLCSGLGCVGLLVACLVGWLTDWLAGCLPA